jgi:hypothetical protein
LPRTPAGEKHAAVAHRLDGAEHVFDRLRLVDVPADAQHHQLRRQAFARVGGDDEDPRVGQRLPHFARDFDAVEIRQHQVDHQQVGLLPQAELEAGFAHPKFSDDLEILHLPEGEKNELTKHGLVFDQNSTKFSHAGGGGWAGSTRGWAERSRDTNGPVESKRDSHRSRVRCQCRPAPSRQ